MWSFFKMLFFGATLTVSPVPVDVGTEWVQIKLEKPLEALNAWANLELDVTAYISLDDMFNAEKQMKTFPTHCVRAELTTAAGDTVSIENETNHSYGFSQGRMYLGLAADGRLPVNVDFIKLRIKASCPLKAAAIYWHNERF